MTRPWNGALAALALLLALAPGAPAADRAATDPVHPHTDPNAPCFRWPAVDMDGDGVFDRIDHCVDTPRGCVVDAWGCQTDADQDGVCDGLDRCANMPRGDAVDEHGCSARQRTLESQRLPSSRDETAPKAVPPPKGAQTAPTAPVSEMERQLVEGGRIRLENVYFETGSATLLSESEATLDEAGRTLEKFSALRIEVQGHTDTRGGGDYNLRLSQARAESVRRYLVDHHRLDPNQIVAKGYGESQPETRERNDEELLRNRRVVLRVLNPEDLPHGVKVENKP